VENGLARIQVPPADGLAQKLLYGQMPVPINDVAEPDRQRLLNVKVLDTGASKAFTELYHYESGCRNSWKPRSRKPACNWCPAAEPRSWPAT